jgi:hypothetical protein
MNPRHGEIWLVDMGIAGKTRPALGCGRKHAGVPYSGVREAPSARHICRTTPKKTFKLR